MSSKPEPSKQASDEASEQSFTIRRRHATPPLAPDQPVPARGRSQAAGKPAARPKVQMRSYIPTNYLAPDQLAALREIVATYLPDLSDPAAVEVLLVLLEVCYILDLSDHRMREIFGARQLHALETWGDIVPPKQRLGLAPQHLPAQALPHRRRRHHSHLCGGGRRQRGRPT